MASLLALALLLAACAGGRGADDREFQTLLDKGRAYLERGNIPMALPALQQANRLQPDHVELLTLLGMAYERAGRPVQSLECLEKAHHLRPSDGNLHHALGVAQLRVYTVSCLQSLEPECQGLLERAEAAFQAALRETTLQAPEQVWFNLALLYKQRGQTPPMVAALEKALAIQAHYLPAQLALAEHYHGEGRFDLERHYLRSAVAAYPDQVAVLERLVAAFLDTQTPPPDLSPGERAEVRSLLARILSLAPGTEAAQRAAQRVLLLDGKQ